MARTIRQLKTVFWTLSCAALLCAFVVEYVLMDEVGGSLADYRQLEFIVQSLMILLTLASIYLALRLFKFGSIAAAIRGGSPEKYRNYSLVRMSMLACPLFLNIVFYLLFINSSFAWLGVIAGLAFPFVYPSKERFQSETLSSNQS